MVGGERAVAGRLGAVGRRVLSAADSISKAAAAGMDSERPGRVALSDSSGTQGEKSDSSRVSRITRN